MKHPELRRYIRHGTLVQLSVFETIVRVGTYTGAAAELHMAQPTVSMHMKRLQQAVGVTLLEQRGRATHLTEAGRELHTACQDIFQKILDVEARLATLRTNRASRIRIASSTTGKYFAPTLLARFWEANPGVEVALSLMNRQSLLHRVEADLDDFYILSDPPADSGLVAFPLLPNSLHIFARADHPLAKRKNIPFDALAGEHFLLREPGSGTRAFADSLFEANGVKPDIRMELRSNEAIKQAILTGIGVAILSHSTVVSESRKGDVIALDVAGMPIKRQWYLAHLKSRPLTPTARLFLEHARHPEALREMADAQAN